MKKIVLIIVFLFKLLPCFNKGKLTFFVSEIFCQNVAGGVYTPANGYTGQAGGYWGSYGTQFGYYFYGGNNGFYNAYHISIPIGPNMPVPILQLQNLSIQLGAQGSGSGGGEGYGDEDGGDDSGWDDGWDDLLDYGGGDGSGGGGQNLSLYDCNGDYNGNAYINACGECVGGRSQNLDNCGLPPKLYLQLNNYSTKYYDGDTIYVPKSNLPIKLTVIDENGLFDPNHTEWLRNDTSKCNNIDNCHIVVNERKITNIKVDSIGTKTLIECPLVVYNPPTIYFQKHNGYAGEYGFDDEIHKYYWVRTMPAYSKGYQVKKIHEDTAYYVPWMSLLDNQFATIKIKKVWTDSIWVLKDQNSEVRIRSRDTFVKINNSILYTIKYSQLNSLNSVTISGKQSNINTNAQRLISSIHVTSNLNDTLGKLRISCSKPKEYRVTYVYVNTGSGYDSSILSRVAMLNILNNQSHNQFFRKWNLYSGYSDTLDLSYEYIHNPSSFSDDQAAYLKIKEYYKIRKGLDVDFINGPGNPLLHPNNKKHIYFITTRIPTSSYALTSQGWTSGVFWSNARLKTVAHEHGHVLNLGHTFEIPFNIQQNSTTNYMDSRSISSDNRSWFSYFQWNDVF